MTIYSAGGIAASGSDLSGLLPDGPTTLTAIDNGHLPLWVPSRQPIGDEFDTLARFLPATEAAILADGGLAHGNRLDYATAAATRATLGSGRYGPSVLPVTTNGVVVYPIDGLLPLDEWTIEISVHPGAAALSTLSNVTLWKAIASNQTIALSSHLTTMTATYSMDGQSVSASLTIASGDVPSGAFTVVSLVWDASAGTLRILLGDNAKTAVTGSPSANPAWNIRPFSADPRLGDHGLVLGHDRTLGGTPTGIKVSDAVLRRYKRTYNQQSFRPKPGITITLGTTQGAFKTRLGGLVYHHTGWGQDEASETNTSTRALQLAMVRDAGCTAARIAEHHKRAIPTVNATAPGSITSIAYTDLDAQWDRIAAAGVTDVHAMVGYVPGALGGGASGQTPPTVGALTEAQSFDLFASYASSVFGHLKARYPGLIKSISFFNEPSLSWGGTVAQLKDLWRRTAIKFAADHPDLPALGGPDELGVSSYTTGVMDQAQTSALALGSASVHVYDPTSLTTIWENVDSLNDNAVSRSLTPSLGVTEWGEINNSSSGYSTGNSVLAQEAPQRQNGAWMAAYVHAALYEMYVMGVAHASFFRLGQQATYTVGGGGEEMMAAISNTGRPWPVFAAFELFWKHAGNRVSAVSNWPGLRALASVATDGRIVVTYSSFQGYKARDVRRFQLAWASGLPATFTWQQFRADARDEEEGRPILIAQGDETNLPAAVELANVGVGAIEITP